MVSCPETRRLSDLLSRPYLRARFCSLWEPFPSSLTQAVITWHRHSHTLLERCKCQEFSASVRPEVSFQRHPLSHQKIVNSITRVLLLPTARPSTTKSIHLGVLTAGNYSIQAHMHNDFRTTYQSNPFKLQTSTKSDIEIS